MSAKMGWALDYAHKMFPDDWGSQVFTREAMEAGIPVRHTASTAWLAGF